MTESVRIENIRKTFGDGDIVAVDDVSFSISSDEFVVIVGPSGCGKTTTLRCIAGLEEPDSGSIYLDGEDVTREAPKDRSLAMVFQNIALFPHMGVRRNMRFGLDMTTDLSDDEKNQRVDEAAEMLGIEDLLDRRPAELSGGQQQRVSIGRALVTEPVAVLLDEPVSDLDANLRDTLRTEVKKLQRQVGKSMIFVTHDQAEAMTLGDKIVVMNNAEISQLGTPSEIYNDPADEFVAGFIGSPSTNFLECTVRRDGDETLLVHELFEISLPDDKATAVGSFQGETVTLGIRPQWMQLRDAGGVFDSTVSLIEQIGSRDVVYLEAGEREMTAVVPQGEVTDGQMVSVTFDADDAWIFDREGDRIV